MANGKNDEPQQERRQCPNPHEDGVSGQKLNLAASRFKMFRKEGKAVVDAAHRGNGKVSPGFGNRLHGAFSSMQAVTQPPAAAYQNAESFISWKFRFAAK